MDFKSAKQKATQLEAERQRAEHDARLEHAELLREAQEVIVYKRWQDGIVRDVQYHLNQAGAANTTITKPNPYAQSTRARNGVETKVQGATPRLDALLNPRISELDTRADKLKRVGAMLGIVPLKIAIKATPGMSAPNLGRRSEKFTSQYQITTSYKIPIGEIDSQAADGLTHGFVEFFVEEGVQAIPMRVGKARKIALKGGDMPLLPTGGINRCGVCVYAGDEQQTSVIPIGGFEADLLTHADRVKVDAVGGALAADPSGMSDDVKVALRGLVGLEYSGEAGLALGEIDQFVDMADAEIQRQAQAAATTTPTTPIP